MQVRNVSGNEWHGKDKPGMNIKMTVTWAVHPCHGNSAEERQQPDWSSPPGGSGSPDRSRSSTTPTTDKHNIASYVTHHSDNWQTQHSVMCHTSFWQLTNTEWVTHHSDNWQTQHMIICHPPFWELTNTCHTPFWQLTKPISHTFWQMTNTTCVTHHSDNW